jgi:hypothetical protein
MNKNFRKNKKHHRKNQALKIKAAKKQIALPGLQPTRKQHIVFSSTSKSKSIRKVTAAPS